MPTKLSQKTTSKIPFLKKNTVLILGGYSSGLDRFYENHKETFFYASKVTGYKFLYLPEILGNLSPELINLLFPGSEGCISAEEVYAHIRKTANLEGRVGFLYKIKRTGYFYEVPGFSEEEISRSLDPFFNLLEEASSFQKEKKYSSKQIQLSEPLFEKEISIISAPLHRRKPIIRDTEKSEEDIRFSIAGPEPFPADGDVLDQRTLNIIEEWRKFEKEYGITIDRLAEILRSSVRLSHLVITRSNRIILEDWPGRPEVKMAPLSKTLYFFYLRHPEGAPFKDLPSYEDEFLSIYKGITGRDDNAGIKSSIDALVNPYDNSKNVLCSRVKKAFREILGVSLAESYSIIGKQKERKYISLDRDLVIWEKH